MMHLSDSCVLNGENGIITIVISLKNPVLKCAYGQRAAKLGMDFVFIVTGPTRIQKQL
jgi:hypothetical protein